MKQNKLTSQKPQWDASLMLQQINKPNDLHVRISLRGFTTSENLPLLVKPPHPPKRERQEEKAVYLEHSVSDVFKL